MKTSIATGMLLVSCAFSPRVSAGSCKPDVSREDKITKQRNQVWVQSLFETGLLSQALLSTSGIGIYATVGSYGSAFAINVELHKSEESAGRAMVESAYRGAKGNQFLFGVKDGAPLAFVATEAGNDTKVDTFGNILTTVVLSSTVSLKDLAMMRETLTTKNIDAVRIVLVGGTTVEENVKDKFGEKLREKFDCFYQALDKSGIKLPPITAAGNPAPPASSSEPTPSVPGASSTPHDYSAPAPGRYTIKGNTNDYVEFSPDGTFFAQRGPAGFAGTYKVQGDVVTMQMPTGQATRGRFSGNTLTDSDGIVWENQAAPAKLGAPSPTAPPSQPTAPKIEIAAPPDYTASAPGKWLQRSSASSLELKPDGSFSLQQGGKTYGGYYKIQGDTMTTQFWNAPTPVKAAAASFHLGTDTMVESTRGTVWEKGKHTESPKAATTQLTIDQVIQMVGAKVPDDIIITSIQHSGSKFDLSPENLIKLKTAGVSDAVIRAMAQYGAQETPVSNSRSS